MAPKLAVVVIFLNVGAVRLDDFPFTETEGDEFYGLATRKPLLFIESLNRTYGICKSAAIEIFSLHQHFESVDFNQSSSIFIKEWRICL